MDKGGSSKRIPLIVPVLWAITTAVWIVRLCLKVHYNAGTNLLDVLVILSSLAAAAVNYKRYLRGREAYQEK